MRTEALNELRNFGSGLQVLSTLLIFQLSIPKLPTPRVTLPVLDSAQCLVRHLAFLS